MHVIEIEEGLALRIDEIAKSENKSLTEFVNLSLREILERKRSDETIGEKIKRFSESYRKFPQQPDEYEIWQGEQIWEDE